MLIMSEEYTLKYTESGGLTIAYQIWGSSEDTLIYVPGMISHLEAGLEDQDYLTWIRALSKFFRVIIFDKRGQGLSDRDASAPNLEERMDDISSIVKAEKLDQFFLLGLSEGASISLIYAATYPQKVKSVAVFGGTARFTKSDDYRLMPEAKKMKENLLEKWGTGSSGYIFCPQRMPEKQSSFAKLERMVCNPKTLESVLELLTRIDIRASLPDIKLPVLVMHSRDDVAISKLNGRYLADNIPGAKYIEYPNGGHLPWHEERESIIKDLKSFFSETGNENKAVDRSLATILFTDIENSTLKMTDMGDEKWSEKLDKHDKIMEDAVKNYSGRIVKNTGDGILAVFDGPVRSIECAKVSIENMKNIGLDIRCSLHVGEIVWRNDDITGIAVNIASRILDRCESGNVVISKNLRDLLGRSEFAIEELGDYSLKGVEGDWKLFKVT